MKSVALIFILVFTIGFAHLSVQACMCPGVNPEIYPPDIDKYRVHYRDEFKGASFTGMVLSSSEVKSPLNDHEKLQEVTIEVDRYWFGVSKRVLKIYTPADKTGCWSPFKVNERYFFIPRSDKQLLRVEICTYATFNRKSDGNYVDLMVKIFGKGKKFKSKAFSSK